MSRDSSGITLGDVERRDGATRRSGSKAAQASLATDDAPEGPTAGDLTAGSLNDEATTPTTDARPGDFDDDEISGLYDGFLADIKAGRIVNYRGRSARTQAELDFIVTADRNEKEAARRGETGFATLGSTPASIPSFLGAPWQSQEQLKAATTGVQESGMDGENTPGDSANIGETGGSAPSGGSNIDAAAESAAKADIPATGDDAVNIGEK